MLLSVPCPLHLYQLDVRFTSSSKRWCISETFIWSMNTELMVVVWPIGLMVKLRIKGKAQPHFKSLQIWTSSLLILLLTNGCFQVNAKPNPLR